MKFILSLIAVTFFALFSAGIANACQSGKGNNLSSLYMAKKDTVKTHKKENLGIGPIKEVKLGPINKTMVKEGEKIFNSKCFACHRLDSKLVGPALKPIVKKTNAVYLMNYLLNTTEMQAKEPELKKLIKKFNGILMPNQSLNKKQARSVLEYLRSRIKK